MAVSIVFVNYGRKVQKKWSEIKNYKFLKIEFTQILMRYKPKKWIKKPFE